MAEPLLGPHLIYSNTPAAPLDRRSGGGDDGGMELVARVDAIEKRMGKVEDKLDVVALDIVEIKGRVSQLPTTFQILTWFIGVAIGLSGLVFLIARITAPIR
jgi:hypothetical protein